MARLAGKSAIITGAARGMGRAMALRFAEEACSLALCDMNFEGVQETAALATKRGVHAVAFRTDVTKRAEVEQLVNDAVGRLGIPDILVNNAGAFSNAAFDTMTDEEWHQMINTNLTSVFLVSQAVIRYWLAKKLTDQTADIDQTLDKRSRSIINMASISASVTFTRTAHYSAAKAGVAALTRSIALEFGPYGIRANSIAPGIVESKMIDAALNDSVLMGDWIRRIPLKRLGQPADVADLAVFLASEDSRYITGDMIYVDGGWMLE
jgi:NAD(P)-dependent dehydrogenase (short-subunit alcohol dehydrogenase family)